MRIPVGIQTYPDRSIALTSENLKNLYVEAKPPNANASSEPVVLKRTPGLTEWTTAGTTAAKSRGACVWKGDMYRVQAGKLFKVETDKTVTELGAVNTNGQPVFAKAETHLVLTIGGSGYLWDGATFQTHPDSDFSALGGADWCCYLDTRVIFGKSTSNSFFWSAPGNPLAIDALDFASAESSPDNIVRGFVLHGQLYLMGEETGEVWWGTGNQDAPFRRVGSGRFERGIAAFGTLAADDNALHFLGNDRIVYRMDGRTPVRISQHGIEQELESATISDALAFFHTYNGHKFYVLDLPTTGATYALDLATGLWAQRESYGLSRWRCADYVEFAGKRLVGDRFNNSIYSLEPDVFNENGDPLVASVTCAPIESEQRWIEYKRIGLNVQCGYGSESGNSVDPEVSLEFSDNYGANYGNALFRSIGKSGQFHVKPVWDGMGMSQHRTLRFTIGADVPVTISGITAELQAHGH